MRRIKTTRIFNNILYHLFISNYMDNHDFVLNFQDNNVTPQVGIVGIA